MTDTNDIVEPDKAILWLRENADRFHKYFNLHPEVKTAYELADLIEELQKDLDAYLDFRYKLLERIAELESQIEYLQAQIRGNEI